MPHVIVKTALRKYQSRAVEIAKKQSLIVVLPTGSGKTLIASATSAYHAANGSKILFLVPTCLLVQQQARAVSNETGLSVAEYMGGAAVPAAFQVLVSTPAAFISLNASSNPKFRYETFGCIIFDEVHHVMKKHPYRKIARSLSCIHPSPLILGLTASLTYAMGPNRIQAAIVELCGELNISGDCIFSASQEELITDGYFASIKSTVQLTSDLDLGAILDGLEIPGKPHEVMSDFMRCYKARTLHPLSLETFDLVYVVERLIHKFDGSFVTPIGASGKRGKSGEWGSYANSQGRKFSGMNARLYNVLEHLYEAVRLIINSRQAALELAMCYLEMTGVLSHPVLSSLCAHWNSSRDQFCRVAHLKEILMQQHERFSLEDGLRCIVFVQQRITTHILHHAVSSDPDFASMLTSDYIYATSSPATCTLSISPTKSRQTVQKFRDGKVQVLLSTSVAEEGMDVPAANCVVRFDAITTPVSLVQSRGRARQADSAFLILSETNGRSVQSLEKAELAQHKAISAVNITGVDSFELIQKRQQAQASRRLNARPLLVAFSRGENKQPALATLNSYAQKISGEIIESIEEMTLFKKVYGYSCTLRLMQFGADELSGKGEGATKKVALQNAANMLMNEVCRASL